MLCHCVFRFDLFNEATDGLFGKQINIPLVEFSVMLEAKDTFNRETPLTDREVAFRQVFATYWKMWNERENRPCLKIHDAKR